MFYRHLLLAASALLFDLPSAQPLPAALVTIEASHGGAGQDLTNTTVVVPLTHTYTNATALAEVSTLYLVGTRGDDSLSSITCTPFKHTDGTGNSGHSFTSKKPSYLSTNTVQVGSIVCVSSDVSMAPPALGSSSAGPKGNLSMSLSAPVTTSTLYHTKTKGPGAPHSGSTVTSTFTGPGGAPPSSSTSPPASLNSGNAASGLSQLSSEFFGGLALAGFGLAFAL